MAKISHNLAHEMKEKCTHLGNEIYKLPRREIPISSTSGIHKFKIGDQSDMYRGLPEKVLMVLGATGAGKSTLINAMANYILGVSLDDPFRFKLIDDEVATQTRSGTKGITVYTIDAMEGSRVPFDVTIVDTPGFEDTEGTKRDLETTKQMKDFFSLEDGNGIDHLDAVLLVTPASSARLTFSQHYVHKCVLEIFGKDVENSIIGMVTFCDDSRTKPLVINAVKEAKIPIPDSRFFRFNNSALYTRINQDMNDDLRDDIEVFTKVYWKMGQKSFDKFFAVLRETQSISLVLTKEVLANRVKLQESLQNLKDEMDKSLETMSILHQENKIYTDEIRKTRAQLIAQAEESRVCLDILQSIALKPNPLSLVDYLELMIRAETHGKKKGWNERTKHLKQSKEDAHSLAEALADKSLTIEDRIEEAKRCKRPGWEKTVEKYEMLKMINSAISHRMTEKKSWFQSVLKGLKLIGDGVKSILKANWW